MSEVNIPQIIRSDTVTISRSEYDDLKTARFAIDVLGHTLGRYGVNDEIARHLLRQFGYVYTEAADAE